MGAENAVPSNVERTGLQVEVHNGLVNCVRVGEPKEACNLKNPGKEASYACADVLLELSKECENGLIGESESRKPWVRPLFVYLVGHPLTFADLVGSVLLRSFKGLVQKSGGYRPEKREVFMVVAGMLARPPKPGVLPRAEMTAPTAELRVF